MTYPGPERRQKPPSRNLSFGKIDPGRTEAGLGKIVQIYGGTRSVSVSVLIEPPGYGTEPPEAPIFSARGPVAGAARSAIQSTDSLLPPASRHCSSSDLLLNWIFEPTRELLSRLDKTEYQ